MGRRLLFIGICLIGSNALFAQVGLMLSDDLHEELFIGHSLSSDFSGINPQTSWQSMPKTDLPSAAPHAFFCRLEWQLEKIVNMPIRFRLGDVEYVDRLEGKR